MIHTDPTLKGHILCSNVSNGDRENEYDHTCSEKTQIRAETRGKHGIWKNTKHKLIYIYMYIIDDA